MSKKQQNYLITLNKIDPFREDIVLKSILVSGNFTAELSKEDANSIIFKKDSKQELMVFTFESNYACEEAMTNLRDFIVNDDNDYNTIELSLIWDDDEQKYEREKMAKERRDAWNDCSCQGEDGCDLCLKNPKYELKYLSERY